MKNSELLAFKGSERLLTTLDNQRRFVLRTMSYSMPCPSCNTPQNQFEAMGIAMDEYDMTSTTKEEPTPHCVHCKRPLREIVPLMRTTEAGWFWEIDFAAENPEAQCSTCGVIGNRHGGQIPHTFSMARGTR
jgi:hypothetical protein